MSGDTFHGFIFWFFFWLLLGPFIVLVYVPIGVTWVLGYEVYLGCKRFRHWRSRSSTSQL